VLRVFSINYNTLGDRGVETICQALGAACRLLEIVDLSEVAMGDRGAAAVVKYLLPPEVCAPLIRIDLSCNRIGAAGAAVIAGAFTGESFAATVDGNAARSSGSDAAATTEASLPVCSVIEHIDLGNNPLTDKGGLVLARACGAAPRLRTLDLTSCDLPPEAGPILIQALESRPSTFRETPVPNNPRLLPEHRAKLWSIKKQRMGWEMPPRTTNANRAPSAPATPAAAVDSPAVAAPPGAASSATSSSSASPSWITRAVVVAAVVGIGAFAVSRYLKSKQQ
jgi:hypothetical protein